MEELLFRGRVTGTRLAAHWWLLIVMAASGLAGAQTDARPTGDERLDVVLVPAFAAAIPLAAALAPYWTRVPLTIIPAAAALEPVWALLPISLFLEYSSGGPKSRRASRVSGALTGAVAAQLLLRIPPFWFFGAPSLAAALAIGPALVALAVKSRRLKFPGERGLAGPGLLVAGLVVGLFAVTAQTVRAATDEGLESMESAVAAAARGDQERAVEGFDDAANSFERAGVALRSPQAKVGLLIPGVSQQLRAADTLLTEAELLAATAHAAAEAFDLGSLYSNAGWVDFAQFDQAGLATNALSFAAADADRSLRGIDRAWLLPQLADVVDRSIGELEQASEGLDLAQQAVQTLPALLGSEEEQRVLVLLATPAETREMGGFVGTYALLSLSSEGPEIVATGPTPQLGRETEPITDPEPFSDWFLRYDLARYPQNLTGTMDLRHTLAASRQLFPDLHGGPVDTVMYLDPEGVGAFVEVLGSVTLPNTRRALTGSQMREFLMREQYFEWPQSEEQNERLAELFTEVFDQFVTGGLPAPNRLATVFGPRARGGHIAVATGDEATNRFLAEVSLLRSIPIDAPGDFFSVVQVNAAPSKLDAYLERSVAYRITFDPATGQVEGTATVELQSTAGRDLAARLVAAGAQPGDSDKHRVLLSLFTPHRVTSVLVDERPAEAAVFREYGANRAMVLIELDLGRRTVVEYELSGRIEPGDYHLNIYKQPVAEADDVLVDVNVSPDAESMWSLRATDPARSASRFDLTSDVELHYRARASQR